VISDRDLLVVADLFGAIVADIHALVVLHFLLLVVLRVDVDQFCALGVVERNLVVSTTALGAVRFDTADDRTARHTERRHLLSVINAAGDDRLIRVAFQEINDDFLADSWNRDSAPALPGPWVRDADPA